MLYLQVLILFFYTNAYLLLQYSQILMFQQDNYYYENNFNNRKRNNRQHNQIRVPPINLIPPLPKNLVEDDPMISSQQYREMFQLQANQISPIIGNRFEDKIKRTNQIYGNEYPTRGPCPKWKTFIHPDLDHYYESLTGKRVKNNARRQFNTPINRRNSQYTSQLSQNGQNQHFQFNLPVSKSHNLSSGNQQLISTKNKSTVQNQIENSPNEQIQTLKRSYEEKISVLEHQNTNLKDELFYLRAAILAHYQSKTEKTNSQKSL